MLRLALKRSSHLATLRSLAAVETLLHHHFSPPAAFRGDAAFLVKDCCAPRQFFHSKPERLDFEATLAPRIESAVEDSWYDDEKVSPFASKGNGDDGLDIAKLGISEEIVSALANRGITKLFPIQRAVLEPAMKGRDMYGRARTGTGKTLAFGIPILDKIVKFNQKHGRGKYPLALVLAPTRELARQVEKEFRESAPNLDTICVYGGTPINRQMRELDYGVDIAVGTPGRIIDLMKRGALNLSEVQFVVIDEADQMLGVGFVDDVETIFQRLPKNRQSMLFSATMPSWIRNLIRNYLKDPLTIDLVGDSDQKLADGISLFSIAADMYGKASILVPLIKEHANGGKCIIFTQTKRDADRLANAMARSLRCEALHGDISQFGRERTLSGFRNGDFNILVATDVAARGLDIPNVDLIIHYEIPNCAETFVHRSGRTGRAGKKGTAILIYTEDQTRQVRIFEREVGCRFTQLPRIAAEDANQDMLNCMDNGGRYSSFGGMRDRVKRFARSGSFGDYGSGQGGQFSGQTNGYGRSGYNRNQGGKFGGFEGASGRAGSFGDFGSDRPSRFGDNSRRNSAFGDLGSNRPSRFGDNSGQNSAFGDFGLDQPARFGNNFSNQNKSVPSDSQFSFGRRQS